MKGKQYELESILKKYWGYDSFRDGQKEIITSILKDKEVLALLATGGGKSICYQIAGLATGLSSIVVSPLISLMKDQVDRLVSVGIRAAVYSSDLNTSEKKLVLDDFVSGKLQFLYISPESLGAKLISQALKYASVGLIAIDEAHCVSIWGHDFRPAYLEIASSIGELKKNSPEVAVAAFTATATTKVSKDITRQLGIPKAKVFKTSFARTNLAIKVMKNMKQVELSKQIRTNMNRGAVLIYTNSRRRVEELAGKLTQSGIETSFYHAGLSPDQRVQRQEQFLNNNPKVMVATNAFGMGVDKPDITCVIHERISDSLENYYQEAGRAGRNGSQSTSIVNFDWQGVSLRAKMLEDSYINPGIANKIYNFLRAEIKNKGLHGGIRLNVTKILEELEEINIKKLSNTIEIFNQKGVCKAVIEGEELRVDSFNCGILFLSRYVNFTKLKKINAEGRKKLTAMVDMCMQDRCRQKIILDYFGEASRPCEICDICTGLHVEKNVYDE